MRTREVARSERPTLHPHFAGWLTPDVQCAPGSFWPSLGQLDRADLVFATYLDDEPVGAALVEQGGRIVWLLTRPGHTSAAFVALCAAVHEVCGACAGYVVNPCLRATYLAATPALTQVDPDDPAVVAYRP